MMLSFEQYLIERKSSNQEVIKKSPEFYTQYKILATAIDGLLDTDCDLVDGRMDIYRSVEITSNLSKIPVPIGRVEGDFIASNIGLTTLENGPTEVSKNFDVTRNKITSLYHAPKKVGKNAYLSSNKLTTIKGDLSEVGGDLSIQHQTTKFGQRDIAGIHVQGRVFYK